MSVVQRVLRRPVNQFPERNIKRVLQQNSTLNGLAGQLTQGFENGIHLDFVNDFHYIKIPGQDPLIAPFTTLFTFTGDNLSYYRGSNGLLRASVTNTPRIEYDVNGKCLGILIEGSRTNLGIQSNDMTNATWVKTTMSTAKTATGPDGVANSATTITATAGNATVLQTVVSGSATRTYSVWLKRRTGTGNVDLTLDNGTGWTTRAITTSWAKYSITQTAVTNPVFGIRIVTNGDAVDVWCNQLESASFASSSIPTVAASVTRATDVNARTFGTEVSTTTGTILINGITASGDDGSSDQMMFSLDDGANTNRIQMYRDPANSNVMRYLVIDGNVTQVQTAEATVLASTEFKYATGYTANLFTACLNGGTVTTDTSGTTPTGMTTVRVGMRAVTAGMWFGYIKKLDYFTDRKPNSQLQSLTT